MITAPLLISLAFIIQTGDPVGGNPQYVPRLGEKGILYSYSVDEPPKWYNGFVDLSGLVELEIARKAHLDEHKNEIAYKPSKDVVNELIAPFKAKGQVITLTPKTSIEILGYGNFDRVLESYRPKENTFYIPLSHVYYVRVLDGEHKGKLIWVHRMSVRIPDSKPFELLKPMIADEQEDKGFGRKLRPTEDEDDAPPQKITLIDTEWELEGNYTKVYARVKNTTDRKISRLKATATFEDTRNKLVRTEWTYAEPDTLSPGDVATIEISTKADPRIDHYGLKFHANDKDVPYNRPQR